jgi:peptide deformylase
MILQILPEGDPFLKTVTEEFDTAQDDGDILEELGSALHTVMKENRALGVAATQCGLPYRVFVMFHRDGGYRVCFNPEVIHRIGEPTATVEGCLSFPDLELKVKRQPTIQVRYTNEKGWRGTETMTGLEAVCFQHELDHLDGITFDTHVGSFTLKRAKDRRKKNAQA